MITWIGHPLSGGTRIGRLLRDGSARIVTYDYQVYVGEIGGVEHYSAVVDRGPWPEWLPDDFDYPAVGKSRDEEEAAREVWVQLRQLVDNLPMGSVIQPATTDRYSISSF